MAQLKLVHEPSDASGALQVVFVHGLNLTGAKDHHSSTWMHDPADRATLWPRWLGEDTNCTTWLFSYDADAFAWTDNAMSLQAQGLALLNRLAVERHLKGKPFALVGHSMGGLVIKQALVSAWTNKDPRLVEPLQRVKAVVFIASPHQGSQLASLAKVGKFVLGTNQHLAGMSSNNWPLRQLNEQFQGLHQKHPFAVQIWAEQRPIQGRLWGVKLPWLRVMVVDINSSDPGIPGVTALPAPEDHIQIARPRTRQHDPYPNVLELARTLSHDAGAALTTTPAPPAALRAGVASAVAHPEPGLLQTERETLKFDVFLCHNHADKPAVRALASALKARGLQPWLDEDQLRPGQPWQRLLEHQIKSIGSAAVCVGQAGIGPWQMLELEGFLRQFVKRSAPVIPVLLADAMSAPELPVFLDAMTYVDLRLSDPDPMDRLEWGITGVHPRHKPSRQIGTALSGEGTPEESVPSAPWPDLPALGRVLTDSEATQLQSWARQPVTNLHTWALHRYATLRLGRLGGDESAGHESFVNLQLQPTQVAAQGALAQEGPKTFESMDELLKTGDGAQQVWLLKGAPGAGKSTLLLDLELRRLHSAIDHWRSAAPGLPELCVRVSLADFDASAAALDLAHALPARWAEQCVPRRQDGVYPLELAALRDEARLRPLLDGLNEIAANHDQRRRFTDALQVWATQTLRAGGLPPVFTVRQLNYLPFRADADRAAVRVVDVQGWSLEQIEAYCDHRFPGQRNPVWREVMKLPPRERAAMQELFANPFNLAAQCWLFAQPGGVLAPNRGELLGRIGLLRLKDAVARRVPELMVAGLLQLDTDENAIATLAAQQPPGSLHTLALSGAWLAALQEVAGLLQQRSAGGWGRLGAKDEMLAKALIAPALRAAQALKLATCHPNGEWQFDHQLWQEYFAAWQLAAAGSAQAWPDFAAPAPRVASDDAWELPPPDPSPWDQCAQLAVQIAAQPLPLVQHLLQVNPALAARAVLGRAGGLPAATLQAIKAAMLERSRNAALGLVQRIEAGELLGQLGDDLRYERLQGPGGQAFVVPRAAHWIALPSGTHAIGGLDEFRDSRNVVPVSIAPDLRLAFAPVTNAEFRCFVEAGGYGGDDDDDPPAWWQGQSALKWWRGELADEGQRADWKDLRSRWKNDGPEAAASVYLTGVRPEEVERDIAPLMDKDEADFDAWLDGQCAPQRHREPADWRNGRFDNPLQPVVGVCLYEAQAYARWLGLQWGRSVRLPTEAEWEVAARGGGQRGVHWPGIDGQGPAVEQANSLTARIRRSTPVGVFPAGAAPEGWVDLAGNVWQWTCSAWTEEGIDPVKVNAGVVDDADVGMRAVRGGSWNDPAQLCRAAFRDGFHPVNRNYNVGFRLLVCPIQNPEP